LIVSVSRDLSGNPNGKLVGAIRWDGYVGDLSAVGMSVEGALNNPKYRYRMPFYAKENGGSSVEIAQTTKAQMDQYIRYAVAGGIDYWAFLYYSPETYLDTGYKLYSRSTLKNDVKFCHIFGHGSFANQTEVTIMINRMKQINVNAFAILVFIFYSTFKYYIIPIDSLSFIFQYACLSFLHLPI